MVYSTVAPMMVFYNVGGVVVLLLSQHTLGWKMVRPFFKQLVTTPPLVATVAGIGFALMGWTLPAAVDKTFTALGEMALPLGLLGVGGALVTVKFGGTWRRPLAAELKVVMLLMATPTAVVSYTVALELKGDEALASGSIVLSVLTSIVTLAVIVGAF